MGVQSIEMYAFSYFSDRAVDMGLIGKTYSVVLVDIHTPPPPPPPTTERNRKSRGGRVPVQEQAKFISLEFSLVRGIIEQ